VRTEGSCDCERRFDSGVRHGKISGRACSAPWSPHPLTERFTELSEYPKRAARLSRCMRSPDQFSFELSDFPRSTRTQSAPNESGRMRARTTPHGGRSEDDVGSMPRISSQSARSRGDVPSSYLRSPSPSEKSFGAFPCMTS
jgi:hypothetical protein